MCAGSVIHRIKDYQDTRLMGNGLKSLPVSFRIFTVANLRLCGIPFIRGTMHKICLSHALESVCTMRLNLSVLSLRYICLYSSPSRKILLCSDEFIFPWYWSTAHFRLSEHVYIMEHQITKILCSMCFQFGMYRIFFVIIWTCLVRNSSLSNVNDTI
jgi:hypothetical protein